MRLIDADVLKAELMKTCNKGTPGEVIAMIFCGVIDEQPEVIIRCKDCKYCKHWYADKGRCFLWHETGIDVFEDGFCNYAERRTDE